MIIKTNKKQDLHCWCQFVRIYTVGVNSLGCTPLLSIGQDLHRGRVIYIGGNIDRDIGKILQGGVFKS